CVSYSVLFFFQAEDGIRDFHVTGVQTCALPIMATQARPGRAGPLRPGLPVHQQRLAVVPEGAPDGAEHEPSRELPRQRRGREFLQRPEEGADQAADLPDASHCCFGRVRLHRDFLQPDSPAWFRWRHVTGRVRKALRAERRLSVYGTLAGPHRHTMGASTAVPQIASPTTGI